MITIERALQLRAVIEQAADTLPDETAENVPELFAPWQVGHAYTVGDRVQDEVVLYKCIQAHTSQADWKPSVTPALWTVVHVEPIPEWVQPTGSTDAYMTGDKVRHNDQVWESLIDNNVWEPGAAGTEALWQAVETGILR